MKALLKPLGWIVFPVTAFGMATIDVVIAYDTVHRIHWGDAGIKAEAQAALNFTEGVFANNGLEVELSLVHIFHDPTYSAGEGAFEHFQSKRFQYTKAFGADLFIFFGSNGWLNAHGQATLPGNYCFTDLSYFRNCHPGWVVAHEIGHTLGGGHEIGFGEGLHPYSHAYIGNQNTDMYWTVLANGSRGTKYRIPYYSDPELYYGERPIGNSAVTAEGYPNSFGADNCLTIGGYLETAGNRESQCTYLWRDSEVLPNGKHRLDWLGIIDLTYWHVIRPGGSNLGRYFHHEFLGWCWVPLNTKLDNLWLWSHRFEAWVYIDEGLYQTAWVSKGAAAWVQW